LRCQAAAILAGMLILSGAAQAQAQDRMSRIRTSGELRVCIWPEYFSITYRNPRNSELSGIDIDLANEFARRLGVRVQFVETNFRDFMDVLDRDGCDIAMFGVGVTPQRVARIDFAQPYLSSPVYGVTTRNNTLIQRWEDIDRPGNAVAVAAGTFMEPLMQRSLRHATMVSVAPPQTREAELQAGRVDVFMSDFPYTRRMVLQQEWVRIIEPPAGFGATAYAHAVAKGDPAWLAQVNAFIAAARADGTLQRAAEANGLGPIAIR
jgi:ABC-type amino acid transport substrate-binding protein